MWSHHRPPSIKHCHKPFLFLNILLYFHVLSTHTQSDSLWVASSSVLLPHILYGIKLIAFKEVAQKRRLSRAKEAKQLFKFVKIKLQLPVSQSVSQFVCTSCMNDFSVRPSVCSYVSRFKHLLTGRRQLKQFKSLINRAWRYYENVLDGQCEFVSFKIFHILKIIIL